MPVKNQPLPAITAEEQTRLNQLGYIKYQPTQVTNYFNPHKPIYWLTNLGIGTVAWLMRRLAKSQGLYHLPYTMTIIAMPFCAILSLSRLDSRQSNSGRRSLKHQLLPHKLTQEALTEVLAEYDNQISELQKENAIMELRIKDLIPM